MKVKYNRPLNLQDIIDQLKIMQAIGKIDTISELIEDIEWLKRRCWYISRQVSCFISRLWISSNGE